MSLYILDTSPLSDMLCVNIFSHSVACLFRLLTVFCRPKVFNFKEVQWISFSFMDRDFGVKSKKIFSYVFFSKSFRVVCLTRKSVIHVGLDWKGVTHFHYPYI